METTKFIEIVDRLPQTKDQLQPCEDCEDLVKNRVVDYVVYALGTKNQHWKKCCRECGRKDRISHPLKKL